jgi:hypothetical protein
VTKPRHGARVDDIQAAIVAALRAAYVQVLVLDVSEEGAPDLLCGWCGSLTLLEIKTRLGRVSEAQQEWHVRWARSGVRVVVVHSLREALDAIGVTGPRAEENLRALRQFMPTESPAMRRHRLRPSVRRPG